VVIGAGPAALAVAAALARQDQPVRSSPTGTTWWTPTSAPSSGGRGADPFQAAPAYDVSSGRTGARRHSSDQARV